MEYFELFTNYQINTSLLALFIIATAVSGLFLFYTNDFKPTIITFISVILIPALSGLFLFILYRYFNVEPSEKHTLIMWIAMFINVINLSTLIAKYSKDVIKKDFDIDHVTRHHFTATLNLFITTILLSGASAIFVDTNMLIILGLTALVSSIVIWSNHLVARLLLQDK